MRCLSVSACAVMHVLADLRVGHGLLAKALLHHACSAAKVTSRQTCGACREAVQPPRRGTRALLRASVARAQNHHACNSTHFACVQPQTHSACDSTHCVCVRQDSPCVRQEQHGILGMRGCLGGQGTLHQLRGGAAAASKQPNQFTTGPLAWGDRQGALGVRPPWHPLGVGLNIII